MSYSRIILLGGLAVAALLAGCSDPSGKPSGKSWIRRACSSKAVIKWCYINGNKNIVDLHLKGEDDVVRHLEQEPAAVGALYNDEHLGFYLGNDEDLVYWVETNGLIDRGCKAC